MARLPKIVRLRGIKAKFILLILVLMVLVFTAVTLVLVSRNTSTLRANLLSETKAFSSLATKPIGDTFVIYKDSGRIRIEQQIEKFTDLNSNITNVAIVGADGKVLFSQKPDYLNATVDAKAAAGFDPTYISDKNDRLTQVIYPYLEDFGLRRYSVVYWVSSTSIDANIREVVTSLVILGLSGTTLAALLIYIFVSRFLLSPLKSVSQDALAISHGAIDHQINVKRKDEIADLATSINTMADSLRADIQKLQEVDKLKSEFMIIASHNLRTPLTVMSGNVEMLGDSQPGQDIRPFVKALAAGTNRLKEFADDMLAIAQIEAGDNEANLEPSSLAPLLQSLSTDFKPLVDQKSISFSSQIDVAEKLVASNATYLRTALWNVLDNALKFTPEKGTINLSLRYSADMAVVEIKDSGVGIDPKELPKLFTKFHRGTDIMHYDYEGTGLGLYLTKLVVDQHKGSIDIKSQPEQGTLVTIELPLAK